MSNINERSQAGATEQILREQNQHLRGERDRLEEQLAEAVNLTERLKFSLVNYASDRIVGLLRRVRDAEAEIRKLRGEA
jgi:hypothetical protein